MADVGVFCKTYGSSIVNQILEYMLENQDIDFAVGDMAKELRISKPKAYEVVKNFEHKEYIKKSRMLGKTQLFILNKDNKRVRLFLRDFRECLRLVAEEYAEEIKNKGGIEDSECILAQVFVDGKNINECLSEVN